jgi:glycerol kinase
MSQQMLLGAIDLGTTSVRMILFDAVSHQIVHSHQQEFPSNYPQPGYDMKYARTKSA